MLTKEILPAERSATRARYFGGADSCCSSDTTCRLSSPCVLTRSRTRASACEKRSRVTGFNR